MNELVATVKNVIKMASEGSIHSTVNELMKVYVIIYFYVGALN